MNKTRIFFILFIGLLLRTILITSVPPSPSLDEVSIGWNAYSILKTGKDEYGNMFPLVLRAYDDYRPALYVYTVIPFIFLFGLTAEAVRMPSVLFSVFSIFAVIRLVYLVFPELTITRKKWSIHLAEITGLFVACSPWHVYISRLGHEANLGFAAGIAGLWLFYEWLSTPRKVFLFFSGLSFTAALYGYQSQKIIIPLLFAFLFFIHRKHIKIYKTSVFAVSVFCFIILIPLLVSSLTPEGRMRFEGTSVFTHSADYYASHIQQYIQAKKDNQWVHVILHNPRVLNVRLFLEQYASHFSPEWLFKGSEQAAHKAPYHGLLYAWELPFLLLGFVYLGLKQYRRFGIFLVLLLISPLPSSITTGAPHAMRSFTSIPVWQLCTAAGILYLYMHIRLFRSVGYIVVVCLFVLCSGLFMHRYITLFPLLQSQSFSYAFSKAVQFIHKQHITGKNFVYRTTIGKNNYNYPSYMFVLFHTTFDPYEYLQQGGTKTGNFYADRQFGNNRFVQTFGVSEPNTVYIDTAGDHIASMSGNILFRSYYLDGKEGVVVYEK